MQNGTLFSQLLSQRKRPRVDRSTHSYLYGTFVLHSHHSYFCLIVRYYSFTKCQNRLDCLFLLEQYTNVFCDAIITFFSYSQSEHPIVVVI
jgi:hypothetical protein